MMFGNGPAHFTPGDYLLMYNKTVTSKANSVTTYFAKLANILPLLAVVRAALPFEVWVAASS